jgi:hypothetical protein
LSGFVLVWTLGQSAYDPFKDYPQSSGLKKVTADAPPASSR